VAAFELDALPKISTRESRIPHKKYSGRIRPFPLVNIDFCTHLTAKVYDLREMLAT